jgi:hypothetical protein
MGIEHPGGRMFGAGINTNIVAASRSALPVKYCSSITNIAGAAPCPTRRALYYPPRTCTRNEGFGP